MTIRAYDPKTIELKWQDFWEKKKTFKVKHLKDKKKYYILEMLPYPSGALHMGHVRNYCLGDVPARYYMMKGYNVLHPIGWDAFGMPAENAAIKHKAHPADWTKQCIETMRGQLKALGYSYDWDREIATCEPEYYKWEQLIFTKLFEKGLAYKKASLINWCDKCATVLANEQVEGGYCWRCSSVVQQRPMEQWYLKITDYTEELLSDIDDKLQGWPDRVTVMQKEWIGKSHGTWIEFLIEGEEEPLKIFTTRPDTLFGVTFMSLACEHPLVMKLAKKYGKEKEMSNFIQKAAKIDRMNRLEENYEKEGVFTGAYCINPATHDKVPIFAANFVLMEYGTGAVMAVPGHDQRDFEFAKKHKLPIKVVIQPTCHPEQSEARLAARQGSSGNTLDSSLDPLTMIEAYEGEGVMVNSGEFNNLQNVKGIAEITKYLEIHGVGGPTVNYKLKDWCVSRQRYWGAPIPIIYCDKCGTVPVPEKDLPVELPRDVEFTGEGGSPLTKVKEFVNCRCPKCKGNARRETDTMDTFVESSWYFLRYASPHYKKGPVDPKEMKFWLPVDQYIGGIEHAVGHLMYCRFWTKILRDLGYLEFAEPVKNLMTLGMVIKDGVKMSKSKDNVVSPDEMIEKYGADTTRIFSLFAAPPTKDLEWNEQGVEGSHRFLGRVWRIVQGYLETKKHADKNSEELNKWMHKTIKRVTDDIERYHFNTGISAIMEYINFLTQQEPKDLTKEAIEALILLISPFAPHITEEMWKLTGHKKSIVTASWPSYDKNALVEDLMLIVVQINGKLRDKLDVPVDMDQKEIKKLAQDSNKVRSHTDGKNIVKVIYVPKKLVNIVVK
ncbi:leucine--tRNA ligase [bacterium]|nr:leucine--tRNA ligase [bacterium]